MKHNRSYPRVRISAGGSGAVSQAGGALLVEAVRRIGLGTGLSTALEPWRKPRTVHDSGKVLLDLALTVALGGDRLSDVAMLRAEPAVFGPVASDPTVSHSPDLLLSTLLERHATTPQHTRHASHIQVRGWVALRHKVTAATTCPS